MIDRRVPDIYLGVWSALALLLFGALLLPGTPGWYFAVGCLLWFGVFEFAAIVRGHTERTLSYACWTILDVQDKGIVNRALKPLVFSLFIAAAVLFVGVVIGADTQSMSVWPRGLAAICIACGTLGFLCRHFRKGSSL